MDVRQLSDEQLAVEAAREGSNGPAFLALVDRYRDRVWRICHRLLDHEQDAHDAAQEVFLRLFLHRGKFAHRSKYSTWVHGVAIRTCLAIRRGRGRRRRHEDTLAEEPRHETPEKTPGVPAGLSLDLARMLDILDEEDRAMLILKYAENHDYEELAAIFDLSVSACKMRLSRAREKLQERFPEHLSASDKTSPE